MFKVDARYIFQIKIISFLTLSLALLFLLSRFPNLIEHYYTGKLYIGISGIFHLFFDIIPFSVGDILYSIFICWTIYGLVIFFVRLFKRKLNLVYHSVFKSIITFQVLVLLFYALWGMNYFRQPVWMVLQLQDTSYTINDVKNVSKILIDSLNSTRNRIRIRDLSISDNQVFVSSAQAMNQIHAIDPHLVPGRSWVKASLFTPLLNYMATSGYNNPFTGEAQLNNRMPMFDRPVTACHEMAHQLGFAREDEANFIGFLAAINSKNTLLRYSAYYLATQEFLLYLRRRDSTVHHELKKLLSAPVQADFKVDSTYWTKYEGKIGWLTGKFYNQFLKVNNQPAGLHTYNRMIILTTAYYKKRAQQ